MLPSVISICSCFGLCCMVAISILSAGKATAQAALGDSWCQPSAQWVQDMTASGTLEITQIEIQQPAQVAIVRSIGDSRIPRHCSIMGYMDKRIGQYAQPYAIGFNLRLPMHWNGNFFFEGGGGSNGIVKPAWGFLQGRQSDTALNRGYAVVTTDSGHDNAINHDPDRQGILTFGHDFQARRNYAYAAYPVVTEIARQIITLAYGRAPEYAYFVGCSKGGQEGMVMAQRYPDQFDGILSCAPGFTLPKAATQAIWDTQAFAAAARALGELGPSGIPLLNRAFSDDDLALVVAAIRDACDRLDGVEDGMIQNFRECTTARVLPGLEAHLCNADKQPGCLVRAQVEALVKIQQGAHNSRKELLYPGFAWDIGFGGVVEDGGEHGRWHQGWRFWKIGPYDSTQSTTGISVFRAGDNAGLNITLGALSSSANFRTPPLIIADNDEARADFMLNYDFDVDPISLFISDHEFPESSWDMMAADSLDRRQFRQRGGKLIIVHGVSDPIFSVNDSIRWWEALNTLEGGRAAEFVRLFAVPGMVHCAGGPATDRFNAFDALVNWVEHGIAPERIEAHTSPGGAWPGRSRPLCPYPQQAHYRGYGSIEESINFICR